MAQVKLTRTERTLFATIALAEHVAAFHGALRNAHVIAWADHHAGGAVPYPVCSA